MVRKQQKKKSGERMVIGKISGERIKDLTVEISQTRTDIKSFLKKFKADVAKKVEKYQQYARPQEKPCFSGESQKKKKQ